MNNWAGLMMAATLIVAGACSERPPNFGSTETTLITSDGAREDLTFSEWIRRPSAIVEGSVVASLGSNWDNARRFINTDWEILVHRWLVGEGPTTITLRTPGGTIGEVTSSGSFTFEPEPGSRLVLMLWSSGSALNVDGRYATSHSGIFTVRGDWLENWGEGSWSLSYRSFEEAVAAARAPES